MKKKPYQPPVVKKVSLKITNSVLATCRLSGGADVFGAPDCKIPTVGCSSAV